jgi:hypothetical protein
MENNEVGIKYDGGKLRWSLLPINEIEDILKVLEFGARKYSPDNWKKIDFALDRYYDALMRHLSEWKKNYDNGIYNVKDEESGLSTLSHVGCCILFLMWHSKYSSCKVELSQEEKDFFDKLFLKKSSTEKGKSSELNTGN